ncbi:MAG: pyruvate kinase [Alphaproteobacteria bacterium]|nr:pyruvate kinase [Alphaproteobacteria bacterium]
MPQNTRTKIIATIGPSTATREKLEQLIDAGADAFRFNFSHGTHAEHKERYKLVRKISKEKNVRISVLADLQGPKLRVGEFKDKSVMLVKGAKFVLDMKQELGTVERVTLPHPEIFKALKVNDVLLLNDGNIRLRVDECDKKHAVTTVLVGGVLSSHKGVNLPDIHLPISALTNKDKEDLEFALKLGVDWVCLSFVQKVADVRLAKKLIDGRAWIISKLEKPSAVAELDDIVRESDAVMVARGDLGVECPLPTVPVLQKRIVRMCRKYSKPVIVATQMLESMINAPTPTRAEISDIAAAVYDGADTVMLSAETAAGQYPIEAVSMMHQTIEEVEKDPLFYHFMHSSRIRSEFINSDEADAISCAAGDMTTELRNVAAVVTFTTSGTTTLLTARERPDLPILAVTPHEEVANRMGIVWGTRGYVNKGVFKNFNNVEAISRKIALETGIAKIGQYIVVTAGFPLLKGGKTNLLHIIKL